MHIYKNLFSSLCYVLFLSTTLMAQQDLTGNWLMYFGTNRVSNRLSVHTEAQYRNHTLTPNNIEQLLLRTGLNFHLSKKAMATFGYAYIPSYTFESEQKEPEVTEHRIWQQFLLNNRLGRVKFEHRYRLEQRWVNGEYRDRFRYRLMLFIPINTNIMEKGSMFVGLYNEVFVNANKTFFDRNRLYGALGYQLDDHAGVQLGLLRQRVNDFGKWYLQFALVYNLDFRKTN